MTEELLSEIERANHVRALERELARVQAHRTIGAVVDELIDGLYPKAGDERDE